MYKRLVQFFHLPYFSRTSREGAQPPKSIWGTLFSLLVHSSIVALLWSAPSVQINPPEIPPLESIDATLLPPPPPESRPNNTPSPSSSAASSHTAAPAPESSSKPDDLGQLPPSDITGKDAKGDGNATKGLPKGNPINVAAPNRGFDVKYDLVGKFKGIDAGGSAKLAIRVNGDRYSADLVARSTGAAFSTHSGGVWRKDTIATDDFNELMDLPWPFNKSDKQSSFKVSYDTKKVSFVNRGQAFERDLTSDPLYDYLSAIAYLQAGFQSNAIHSGQGRIVLPIGKRQDIGSASIQVGAIVTGVSTFDVDGQTETIPVTITVDSASIKSIQVWFVPKFNYEPRKMIIVFDKGEVTLLSRS